MSSFISKLFNTPFLQNKFVLYVSLFIVLITVVRHLSNRNTNAVVLMALIGLVSSYFSKNMIIVLLTAFFTVFVLEVLGYQGVMEGMESKKKDGEGETATETEKETEQEAEADAEADAGANADVDADADAGADAETKSKGKKTEKMEGNRTLHTKKEPMKKNKQGMAALSPASYDGKDHDDGENAHGAKESNRIDYASTLEQAYDNIENIIGEDGVRGLTDQTKSLMNQQKELMNNMKEMGPLLKSAEGFMEQLTGNGGIRGITEMLKGFATPGGKKK
jgi:uncharacterized membrane protein